MMDRRGESENEFTAIKGSWSSHFGTRKDPQLYEQENKSYILDVRGHLSTEDDIVELFMEEPSNPVPNSHRIDLVDQFFRDTNLENLQRSNIDACNQPDSLLDDRKPKGFGNPDEDGGLCRMPKGPLNPRQLFFELRKPRYTPKTTSAAETQAAGRTDEVEYDAERRIVYIADANPWSILAIVATASTNQAFAVRDFIYKYLDFQALFSVSIPTGAARYALEVHLPYYAWRKGSRPNKDLRKDGSAQPLRKVRCVPFLQGERYSDDHSSCSEHIYQAQLSFLVSGLDNLSWVGYCFVDTYHDGDESEDSVQNYPSPATSPDEPHMDPASGGNFPASPPFWSPRVYFLQVLQYRIGMIKDEWANVVSMIQFRLESQVSWFQFARLSSEFAPSLLKTHGIPLSRQLQQCKETSDRLEQLSIFYDRTQDTIRLLLDLKHTISKTINAWDAFGEFELGYFSNKHTTPKDADSAYSAILVIRRHFKEIRLLSQALNNQENLYNNIARELEQHLTLENNRTTWIQLQTGENVKSITIIAVLVSPPSVAAAMFSMGSDVLPFDLNLASYFITVAILAILMAALMWFLKWSSRRKIGRTFRSAADPELFRPGRPVHDHWDEENQSIHSSLEYEPVEDVFEMNNLSATSMTSITRN